MSLSTTLGRAVASAAVAALTGGATALPANAQDFTFNSCPGFLVGLTFVDAHGQPPVTSPPTGDLQAGTRTIRLENLSSGKTITVRIAGQLVGPSTFSGSTLHFSEVGDPEGPLLTLYHGHLVTQNGAVVISHSGPATDLCAVLAG